MNLYIESARIIKIIDDKKASIKSLVFASKYPNIRQLYALVCESLKYKKVLQKLVDKCGLDKDSSFQDKPFLSVVLLYEHLLGQGLENAGVFKKAILKHGNKIDAECTALLEKERVTCLKELVSEDVITKTAYSTSLPRYVRVNLLNTTVQDVLATFEAEEWKQNTSCSNISKLKEDEFMVDPVLPDVLIFPPRTELHDHDLYHSGSIVLQDRASCFPAHILKAPEHSVVIDCCAAPGNKTSHIASLMGNTGKIFAFDRDRPRLNTMKTLLVRAGVENAELFCKDFLSVSPEDPQFFTAEYILVDPSCSGSGIVTRLDHLTGDNTSKQRLTSLSNFQASLLKHALKFPNAQRVVYSTCSIHTEENERVVEDVLSQVSETFVLKKAFPDWTTRGSSAYPHGDSMIRVCTEKHLTNGFFVACFERIPVGDNSTHSKGNNLNVLEKDVEKADVDEKVEDTNAKQKNLGKKAKKRKISDNKTPFVTQSCEEDNETMDGSRKKKKKERQMEDTDDLLDGSAPVSDSTNSHSSKKKKKKKHKFETENQLEEGRLLMVSSEESNSKQIKKKKRKCGNKDQVEADSPLRTGSEETSTCISIKKKNRKYKSENENQREDGSLLMNSSEENSSKKTQKKKHKCENDSQLDECSLLMDSSEECISKKKQKKKHKIETKSQTEECDLNENENSSTESSKKKKKRKHELKNESQFEQCSLLDNSGEESISKKKKRKNKYENENDNATRECVLKPNDSIKKQSPKHKTNKKNIDTSESCDIANIDKLEDSPLKKAKKKKKKHSKTKTD
ncbi:28S rRNA (cytosine-C(5))-methyltransferase-like [Gigantopelta aegis]|uniref:28S rRNA (cytosine-C(5))-methyltransferase-like n=1 Tax=Gigantopelta aegis TaxID=1735272 RepID=UPI001B888B25|nr:28S rRNA (cytosine-C(5))-methyltransferase-like [Gigantopelta aegis]